MIRGLIRVAVVAASCGAGALQAHATPARPTPVYNVVSEDLSEQRRSVYLRIERRIEDADMMEIATAVRAREKRTFARTHVNFFLPGMPLNQGAWASVLFAPEPKVMVHGLRREDEELFLSEHRADRRPLLGSWLTSPPAAPGRLSIYSESGRIYAEWRLRGGQRTVDELVDQTTKTGRRFDVPGGGYFVLLRSGELEIWDKTTLIATAERIRPEHLALPQSIALGPKLPPAVTITSPRLREELLSSPAQPEPKAAVASGSKTTPDQPAVAAVAVPAPAVLDPEPIEPKGKPRKAAKKTRTKTVAAARPEPRAKSATPGEQISAKMAGRF